MRTLTIDHKLLKKALGHLTRIVGKGSSTLPVLACIKVVAHRTGAWLTATDLENSLTIEVPAETSGQFDGWEALVPAKKLAARLTKAKAPVELSFEAGEVSVKVGKVSVTFRNPIAVEDWPEIPYLNGSRIASESFLEDLKYVLPAISNEDTWSRPGIAISTLRIDGDKLVGTDGHRLHVRTLDVELPEMNIPRSTVVALHRFAGETVHVRKGETHAQFDGGAWTILVKLPDVGTYPSYDKVIPATVEGLSIDLSGDRGKDFVAQLSELPVSKRTKSIRFTANGRILAESEDVNEDLSGKTSFDFGLEGPGQKDATFVLNRDYLSDAVSLGADRLHLGSWTQETDPKKRAGGALLLTGEKSQFVVMPLRD